MRTSTGCKNKDILKPPDSFRALTHLKNDCSEDIKETQKIDISEIQVPKHLEHTRNNEDNIENGIIDMDNNEIIMAQDISTTREQSTFTFERKRLMVLGQETIKKYECEGPVTDLDKEDPRAVRIENYNRRILEDEIEKIKNWSSYLKFLCVLIIAWEVLEVIFSMVYTFVMALNNQVNIVENTIPLCINIAFSVWLMYVSLKGGSIFGGENADLETMGKFFKMCIVSLVIFGAQFTVMPLAVSLTVYFKNLGNYGKLDDMQKADALMGLGYIVVWLSSLLNAIYCSAYIGIIMMVKKLLVLKDMHELEAKTLPLGYQIFAKLPPQEQGHSVPYNI